MTNKEQLCGLPSHNAELIRLGHGSGGTMTSRLIETVFLPRLKNEILSQQEDAALLDWPADKLAMTTDSFVVSPLFFPGGDIGSLSVYGTVNDLAMRGARPLFITAAFILEEGLPLSDLDRILESFHAACTESGVKVVAADTKVVNRNAADKIFINTTGIGALFLETAPSVKRARDGDVVILSSDIGRHGIAVMIAREDLKLESSITSDSAPLHVIVEELLMAGYPVHTLRDITRGGLATVLNEIAQASAVGIVLNESAICIQPEVQAVCELLGLDPLYVACEGRFVAIVPAHCAQKHLAILSKHAGSRDACIIGEVVTKNAGRVILRSRIGGHRVLDKLTGEQLPRIC